MVIDELSMADCWHGYIREEGKEGTEIIFPGLEIPFEREPEYSPNANPERRIAKFVSRQADYVINGTLERGTNKVEFTVKRTGEFQNIATKFTGALNMQNRRVIRGIYEEKLNSSTMKRGIFRLEKQSYTSTQLTKRYNDGRKKDMKELETYYLNDEFRFVTSVVHENKDNFFTGDVQGTLGNSPGDINPSIESESFVPLTK